MKRITVSITVEEDATYNGKHRRIRTAMINAGVGLATENDMTIVAIEAKLGTPRGSVK